MNNFCFAYTAVLGPKIINIFGCVLQDSFMGHDEVRGGNGTGVAGGERRGGGVGGGGEGGRDTHTHTHTHTHTQRDRGGGGCR